MVEDARRGWNDYAARMRALHITRRGTPVASNVAFVTDHPDPTPAPGEVRVRTEASALNHLDLWVGRGIPGVDDVHPKISGSDGCGVVDAVGAGVDEAWVGRRVVLNAAVPQPEPAHPDVVPAPVAIGMIGEHGPGTMAEMFCAPATSVLDVGDADPVAAAAVALSGLTAWRMLRSRARLRAGQTVLITGIGGGVALSLLAIARHLGARTIVTSRHRSKLDRAVELGADETVLDTGDDFSREVRARTGRRGVDVCADSVGKAIHLSCIRSLARGGVLVTCGATSGPDATTDLTRVFWNQLSILGSTMGSMDEFREVIALFRRGLLAPVLDSTFDAIDGARAYARLESGTQFGKVVVRW